jgi:hypothetical protein
MTIAAFTRTNLAVIRDEMEEAMAKIAAKHGIEIRVGNAKFNAGTVDIKVHGKAKGKQISEAFIEHMKLYGLKANVEINGKTLVEYAPRRSKYPFIYKDKRTGKTMKTTLAGAKLYFAA